MRAVRAALPPDRVVAVCRDGSVIHFDPRCSRIDLCELIGALQAGASPAQIVSIWGDDVAVVGAGQEPS